MGWGYALPLIHNRGVSMKYDSIRKQFYIEKSDVTTNTTISEEDLKAEYGEKVDTGLREASDLIYDYLDSAYRVGSRGAQHHAKAVRYMIYKSKEKQASLLDAILVYIRGDVYHTLGVDNVGGEGLVVPKQTHIKLHRSGLYNANDFDILPSVLDADWGDMG
jgi:hypothetical protein